MVRVVADIESVLVGATDREALTSVDSTSGATFERVVIDGQRYVVKHLDAAHDWTMRGVGDLVGATITLAQRGLLDRLPACIDQPIVAVALADAPPGRPLGAGAALLMHDVSEWLVAPGDAPVSFEQHAGFLHHMAACHATFWDGGAEIDVIPMTNRYLELSPWTAEAEVAVGGDAVVPRLVGEGWPRFVALAGGAAGVGGAVLALARDPSPLVDALLTMPTTLVHGNWKFGNLGTRADGRTVLLDWENPGRGAPASDLAWYLAINSARLPESKEASIDEYRRALAAAGVDTDPWWDRQLALCLLGGLVQFGWEKALGGGGAELDWWVEAAARGLAILGS